LGIPAVEVQKTDRKC